MTFYGSSFITDENGKKLAEANRTDENVITAEVDLEAIRETRQAWEFFRDRRPEHYDAIYSVDGNTP